MQPTAASCSLFIVIAIFIGLFGTERSDVMKFSSGAGSASDEKTNGINDNIRNAVIVIVVILSAALIVLSLTIVVSCSWKTREDERFLRNLARIEYNNNPMYGQISTPDDKQQQSNDSERIAVPEILIIPNNKIQFCTILGEGNFAQVFQGKAVISDEEILVAIKRLKNADPYNFFKEAKVMVKFRHPKILKIYGLSNEPYQMVFEYMDKGDLTQFLRNQASSCHCHNPFSFHSSLSRLELLKICEQIASGMAYLASLKYVHRDLACRNCLVNKSMVVKIGDFGMCRNLYFKDYYRVTGQVVLPVRWMSPEALFYGKFTVLGDVWSFGVVMWEVFSYALQPYYGKSNEQVIEFIRHGDNLNMPLECPVEIYTLMKKCWTMESECRPGFDEILHKISHLCQYALVSVDTNEEDLDSQMSNDSNSENEY